MGEIYNKRHKYMNNGKNEKKYINIYVQKYGIKFIFLCVHVKNT